MIKASDLFDFPDALPFGDSFLSDQAPWEWLSAIKHALASNTFLEQLQNNRGNKPDASIPAGVRINGDVYIHPSVQLPAFASIEGPAYIGEGCELRPGVYIRGNVIAGKNCVLGNSCEFKNCLLLEGVQVPHFSYVGDSILGNKAHLGAGVICSNLRLDQADVKVTLPDGTRVSSKLRKFGALVGDGAEVGCNAVLNPGSILGRRALVMPAMAFSGTLEANTIAAQKQNILRTARTD